VPPTPLSFGARLLLAWSTYFRVLFDSKWAAAVAGLGVQPLLARGLEDDLPPAPAPCAPPLRSAAERNLDPALQLLGLLQREGRLVDFLQQDIAKFEDAQIGAACRVVHAGCRKALERMASLSHIREEAEGSAVTLEAGFDPQAIKLVGHVQGKPPYRGTLRHAGWKLERFELEQIPEDAALVILAQAEVEL
jgi:hypothetical protein